MTAQKTICITGASSGIGAALARMYAGEKHRLILIGINYNSLSKVAQQCEDAGAEVIMGSYDVRNEGEYPNWLAEQQQAHPIDLVIASAGLSTTQAITNHEQYNLIPSAELLLVDVHMKGMLNTIHPFIEPFKAAKAGQIAITSSLTAMLPLANACMYGAVKAAMLHYGLGLRLALADAGVKVNVICPGLVQMSADDPITGDDIVTADEAALAIDKGLQADQEIITFPWDIKAAEQLTQWIPEQIHQHFAR